MSPNPQRGEPRPFSGITDDELRQELLVITTGYPERRAGALMCLHRVQQHRGCVSLDDQILVAGVLGIGPAHVRELMTFYTMYYDRFPARYHLQLCRTLTCQLRGSGALRQCIADRLHIRPGEATADGRFRLTEVECLASCDTAPVIQINDDYFEDITVDDLQALLKNLSTRDDAGGVS